MSYFRLISVNSLPVSIIALIPHLFLSFIIILFLYNVHHCTTLTPFCDLYKHLVPTVSTEWLMVWSELISCSPTKHQCLSCKPAVYSTKYMWMSIYYVIPRLPIEHITLHTQLRADLKPESLHVSFLAGQLFLHPYFVPSD